MSGWHPFLSDIHLYVEGRIGEQDAERQENTARAILRRLRDQPGVVLADEVGMGKTFVALAVAASVALSDSRKRPVVVMVPPGLKQKWPQDFAVFRERCLSREARIERGFPGIMGGCGLMTGARKSGRRAALQL